MKKYCAIAALLVGLIEAIDSRGQICRLAPDQRGYRRSEALLQMDGLATTHPSGIEFTQTDCFRIPRQPSVINFPLLDLSANRAVGLPIWKMVRRRQFDSPGRDSGV